MRVKELKSLKQMIENEISNIQNNCEHNNLKTVDTPFQLWYTCPDCDLSWGDYKEEHK